MPFWKKEKKNSVSSNGDVTNGSSDAKPKEKVNYKARLEHKQYLVSLE